VLAEGAGRFLLGEAEGQPATLVLRWQRFMAVGVLVLRFGVQGSEKGQLWCCARQAVTAYPFSLRTKASLALLDRNRGTVASRPSTDRKT